MRIELPLKVLERVHSAAALTERQRRVLTPVIRVVNHGLLLRGWGAVTLC